MSLGWSISTPVIAAAPCPDWLLGIAGYLKTQVVTSWKILLQDRAFHRERYLERFPSIYETFRDDWQSRVSRLPEAANSLTTDEALALLETLQGQTIALPRDRKQVYARAITVQNETRSASALVKQSHTRLQIDAPTATDQVTVGAASRSQIHDARWEVMAFKLDRFFGMNLVSPAIMINREQSAQLVIHSQAASYQKQIEDPASLMDLSMIRMLDAVLSNSDRDFPGNFRRTSAGRALAVDFDLSSPTPAIPAAIRRRLMISNFPIESGRLGRGWHPGVYSQKVLARMESLTPENLFRMASEGRILLTDSEARAIYSGVRTVLQVVRDLATEFGENLVLVP